jgi:hypothetical protein
VSCWDCHHKAVLNADRWPDDVAVPTFGPGMVCTGCGIVGADARPNWKEQPPRESLTGGNSEAEFRIASMNAAAHNVEPLTADGSMRMFILLAVAIVLVAIGFASSFSVPHTAALVSVKTPNTLSA